jgi:hypothetical protein
VTRLAIVLTGLALSLFAASPAEAARTEFFGIAQGLPLDAQDLQGMAALRIRTDRFLLEWRYVEPSRNSFRWGPIDKIVGSLASHGIRAVPFLWGSPSWARPGPSRPPVGSAFAETAWRNFLKAAVARYKPGGSYWTHGYPQRYGAGAKPLPVQSWQIWNEPNVTKYFDPGQTVGHAARQYARLLQISHDAIKSRDPQAQIVLAGMLPNANSLAWDFLNGLYSLPGFKNNFDVAALHPYARDLDQLRVAIEQFRRVMTYHRDGATPLWLTEVGWGSAPPDSSGINKGPSGQRQMLTASFKLILSHRSAWNVQRLFWFLWRDPAAGSPYARLCSWCGSAGPLYYNRVPKPAYSAFTSFAGETTPPQASLTSGPGEGRFIRDSTPSFSFVSNEDGSTFVCHVDAQPFKPCSSRHTVGPLNGAHTFFVKAIDAPGNESAVLSRSFTVDTVAPAVTISSGPVDGSATSDRNPSFSFASNEPGTSFGCRLDGGVFEACSPPFTASGLAEGSHTFRVKATDRAGNQSMTASTWTVDTIAPTVTISSGPVDGSATSDRNPSFSFASNEPGTSFGCRLDGGVFEACSSPFTAFTPTDGSHTFQVKATDRAGNQGSTASTWTVDTIAPTVTISSGPVDGSATSDRSPSFRFASSESGSDFQCTLDSGAFTPCSSPYTASQLADGRHRFGVRAIDAAGNRGDPLYIKFTVDTKAPKVRIEGPSTVKTRRRRTSVTFLLKASEPVGLRCRIDSRRFRSCSSRYTTPGLRPGVHTIKVEATDHVGNVGTERRSFKIVRGSR